MKRLRLLLSLFLLSLFLVLPVPAQTIESELDVLSTLDFDGFLDESYYMILGRSPESVIELSLQNEISLDGVTLNNASDDYADETNSIIQAILLQLQSRDREALSPAQQVSYDIYEWFLDDLVRGHEFTLFEFPMTFFITADHIQTASFFTDIHPLETEQDAVDYITRLNLVDEKFAQVVEKVETRASAGIIPPQLMLRWTSGEINRLSSASWQSHDYYVTFADKITEIEALSDERREQLLADAQLAVEDSVIPAYQLLSSTIAELIPQAPRESGSWQYPGGDEYYTYTLRHHTTTDLSADEIHEMGLVELERIHAEMRLIFDELAYDSSMSISSLYWDLRNEGETIAPGAVISTFEGLIDEAYPLLEGAFSRIPETEVVVIADNFGGFYLPAALDGSRPGAFYANANNPRPYFNMPSLLYHEAIPGHHLQIAWSQELDLPTFRRNSIITAYAEGWGLYAERLAYDLGWYEDNPEGDLGRLQYEAFRAARLVVDTGLHAKEWTFDEATTFFAENTGFSNNQAQNQIARYVVWPGQATAYMIGMLEILRQRDRVQSASGDDFDLATFHDIILDNGSVPLAILDEIVTTAIAD